MIFENHKYPVVVVVVVVVFIDQIPDNVDKNHIKMSYQEMLYRTNYSTPRAKECKLNKVE